MVTLFITVIHGGIEKPRCSACCDTDCRPAHVSVSDHDRRRDDSMARCRASRRVAFSVPRARAVCGGAGMCGGSREAGSAP